MTRSDQLDAIVKMKCDIVEMQQGYQEGSLEHNALTLVLLALDAAWYALGQDMRKCLGRIHHMTLLARLGEQHDRAAKAQRN